MGINMRFLKEDRSVLDMQPLLLKKKYLAKKKTKVSTSTLLKIILMIIIVMFFAKFSQGTYAVMYEQGFGLCSNSFLALTPGTLS